MSRRFILSFAIGFISHFAARVTGKMPAGWRNLSDHTIGIVTITPIIILWWRFLHVDFMESDEQIEKEIIAAIGLASLAYGIGNATAWVVDTILGIRHD